MSETAHYVHTPVLLEETLHYLAPRSENALMIDATLGEGGHSYAFLSRFPSLYIIGVDADPGIQEVARKRLAEFGERIHFYSGWSHSFFAEYPSEIKRPDSILIDLGISLFHYEKSGRGFSFRKSEALDMRLDPSFGPSAADLVMQLSERELADLIYQNGEERYSRRIAHAIVEARAKSRIETADMLASIIEGAVPVSYRYGAIHPATRTFQALRIAVNGELSRLESLLDAALHVLENGGRLGVITFHSLEDRIVKNFFREKNKDCTCPPEAPICTCKGQRTVTLITKKPVAPSLEEIKANPPSRSAKLRVVEKVLEENL
ncbi:16S rRNA (cytosine(1402)-N(4))-methyltransferase RsmH [Gracilinema caldarium]|uniref:Ribosomal RNA small subunit methyltransferase H n=1 Tax=Gracilinema caldarium (strain ATCC 51460 / DSM 7334 / H1) TaxID=744872 RepID=F8F1Y4_GRAC1|nr:16S rRNA (cytosine(1402)-N(4))-methyltransferase RsmH [Gracilinema caldarium]AEJ19831.1 Ribosomal RNA small subunit methyltransferase H [Gracilinema caldarium DSM 7334]